jgi:hypothetical protein
MSKYIASLDVESIGLYGDPTAWALVIGTIHGRVIAEYSTQMSEEAIYVAGLTGNCPKSDIDWCKANIAPAATQEAWNRVTSATKPNGACHSFQLNSVDSLVNSFAETWRLVKQNYNDVALMADCPFPVETNFLRRATRAGEVYPLLDVNTLVYMYGNPNFPRLESELPIHNPLADARQSYRIWVELTQKANQP